jgi:hypothetical protein
MDGVVFTLYKQIQSLFYCRNNQIIMSNLRFLYITINFPKNQTKKVYRSISCLKLVHNINIDLITRISSEEEIIVRRAESSVDVSHVQQVEVPAACNSSGGAMSSGCALMILVLLLQRAVAAAHLVPEGAAV